ncbi:hypothetical protein LE190_00880 [Massilia oculi]|uniref:PEP-CTERM sorting domain-containing protein n=1 Tax=Massilia hydrophila TaxID=3044279 RepID=A0ABS7Y498_9BURK|nr:hypothetical protein [Massilia oculi]MCA1854483.1 hypothetical protein [Massilia oculi]
MKDVKVDVRVNVTVDPASVFLVLATAAMGVFLYRQNKQPDLVSGAMQESAQGAQ